MDIAQIGKKIDGNIKNSGNYDAFHDYLITQSLSDKDINRIESAKTLHDTRWLDVNDVKYQEIVVVLRKTISTYCESCETNGFNNDLKRFKRWVTSEVLPAIRKHGVFALDDIVNNTDALIQALQAFKAERLKRMALEQEAAVQKQQLAEMRPKASYYDVVLNSPSLMAVSEFAKDYGWSAKRMNQYLHEKGVQYKQGGKIWLLYQKYAGCGYTSTKTHAYPAHDGTTHTKVHTYWTQKGRLFIYDLLKADGILPLIERGN